jgi:hypothetical protein
VLCNGDAYAWEKVRIGANAETPESAPHKFHYRLTYPGGGGPGPLHSTSNQLFVRHRKSIAIEAVPPFMERRPTGADFAGRNDRSVWAKSFLKAVGCKADRVSR